MKRILTLALIALPFIAYAAIDKLGTGAEQSISTTRVLLDDPSIPNYAPRYMSISNLSTVETVYVGGASVTAATGTPIPPGKFWTSNDRLNSNAEIYAITASGTALVRVQEAY